MKKTISAFTVCTMMIISCIVAASAAKYNEPLEVGVRQIVAYPFSTSLGSYYNDFPTQKISSYYRGMGPVVNLTLNENATREFNYYNCDSYYVGMVFYWSGAERYELYCNDELLDKGYCTNPNGDVTEFPMPYDRYNSSYKLIVYDKFNNSRIAWGHIYLDESAN